MATKKEETTESKVTEKKTVEVPESNELSAIAVKSLTNLEEKVEAIDWKLWEIYNIVKNYVESDQVGGSAPQVSQPQPSTSDIAQEVAKVLSSTQETEPKKSVVGKLFGK